ncbi:MAG TPA: glycoside hydrolase family 15 protein [Thermoanaerobaculia bacterium]|nr:glycoside hydrolase family 15 protein [Thermoanaerobaculia bacterium]
MHARRAVGPAPSIGDYALLGDCRSAALVSRDGSLDWLCLPRFDGPAIFAALLDPERGGRFVVHPAGDAAVRRRYLPDTNVLETTFEGGGGVVRLTDAMTVAAEADKRRELLPEHEVLRVVECLEGEVEVEVEFDPRPDYGRRVPRLRRDRPGELYVADARGVLVLRSDIDLDGEPGRPGARGRARLRAGERRLLSLAADAGDPAVLLPLGEAALERLARTRRWWQDWVGRCRYEGPQAAAVVRSALALRLLLYAPSGAVIAAPTTSLPEFPGGVRNWDYRYCWLRDASWALEALLDLGYEGEATAFFSWLLHATNRHRRRLGVVYDLHGEEVPDERELPHLAGFAGSRPVRVGNGAKGQLQLDVFGEVVDTAFQFVERGGTLDGAQGRLLAAVGKAVCRLWREPDQGLWEQRAGARHHTFSKAMCWVALDRLVELAERGLVRVPLAGFRRERDAIRAAVEGRGWSERLGSYVAELDGEELDASLLLLGVYGFEEAGSPRMRATLARVRERLGAPGAKAFAAGSDTDTGLLYRYPPGRDGLPPREGAFGVCGFWAVELMARAGDTAAAGELLERLVGYGNDLGLFAEEIDPATGAPLGNFPQGFTHLGLINAAQVLAESLGQAASPAQPQKAEARL